MTLLPFLVVKIPQRGERDDASEKQKKPEGAILVAWILHDLPLENWEEGGPGEFPHTLYDAPIASAGSSKK